jgi:hypothetical protein
LGVLECVCVPSLLAHGDAEEVDHVRPQHQVDVRQFHANPRLAEIQLGDAGARTERHVLVKAQDVLLEPRPSQSKAIGWRKVENCAF